MQAGENEPRHTRRPSAWPGREARARKASRLEHEPVDDAVHERTDQHDEEDHELRIE